MIKSLFRLFLQEVKKFLIVRIKQGQPRCPEDFGRTDR